MSDDEPNLGRCCACGTRIGVRNILMLNKKAPIPGTGWGCAVCGLAADGAIAVVCDQCIDKDLKFACYDYAQYGDRVAIADLTGSHEHDPALHDPCDRNNLTR